MAHTYGDYLKLDELLELQRPLSDGPEHDETLFIVIHQVYELWFKQLIHELEHLTERLEDAGTPAARLTLRRILRIFDTLISQIRVLETMTPLDFLSFRNFLDSASGFQSVQFRELEFLLGAKDRALAEIYPEPQRTRLLRRCDEPSIWNVFLGVLRTRGFEVPDRALDPTLATEPSEPVQEVLLTVYRTEPALMEFCESLVDLDERLQDWRYRHVQMVQRTIGTRGGTGGSSGAEYLRTTLFRPVFPDLWAIRTSL